MNSIEQILLKNGWKRQTQKLKKYFEEIETKIGFELPQDYKYYATIYKENESFIGNEYVNLWNVKKIIEWNIQYKIFEYLPKTIAIGDNGAGEFIAIEFSENKKSKIILSTYIDLDPEYNIIIGNSFSDFLERLNNEKMWFDN